ncbi:hypothetical protein FACS189473_0070 [Spirochaetia bacterium]|nr:hypothetical protein FACS189473_0070 [Spirochaetia bacterium]
MREVLAIVVTVLVAVYFIASTSKGPVFIIAFISAILAALFLAFGTGGIGGGLIVAVISIVIGLVIGGIVGSIRANKKGARESRRKKTNTGKELEDQKKRERVEEEKRIQELKDQKRREWEAETERLKQSAQHDVDLQYQLGKRYQRNGSIEEAKMWFKVAADSGHEKAAIILATMAAEQKVKERAAEEREAERKAREEAAAKRAKEEAAKKAREEKMAEDEFQRCKALIVQEHQGKCIFCESLKALDNNEAICASLLSPRSNQVIDADSSCSYWKIPPDSYIRQLVSHLKGDSRL